MPTALAKDTSDDMRPLERYRPLPPSWNQLRLLGIFTTGAATYRALLAAHHPLAEGYNRAQWMLEFYERQVAFCNNEVAKSRADRPTFLRMARDSAHLTQDQLSALSGIHRAIISRYERGYLKPDDNGIAERLAITCAFHIANPHLHDSPNYWITPIPRMGWQNLQINGVPFPQ